MYELLYAIPLVPFLAMILLALIVLCRLLMDDER